MYCFRCGAYTVPGEKAKKTTVILPNLTNRREVHYDLLTAFLSFLQIGAFSFGGGYAAMPLIQNQVVQLHPWLSQSEFTDLITIPR